MPPTTSAAATPLPQPRSAHVRAPRIRRLGKAVAEVVLDPHRGIGLARDALLPVGHGAGYRTRAHAVSHSARGAAVAARLRRAADLLRGLRPGRRAARTSRRASTSSVATAMLTPCVATWTPSGRTSSSSSGRRSCPPAPSDGLDALTLGFLTEPIPRDAAGGHHDLERRRWELEQVDASSFDRIVSFDPLIAPTAEAILPVWRSVPLPVCDRLYRDVRAGDRQAAGALRRALDAAPRADARRRQGRPPRPRCTRRSASGRTTSSS